MTMKIFPPKYQTWLKNCVESHEALSGTVHLFLRGRLELAAALDIPLGLRQSLAKLQPGDGMMGLALERQATVHLADLDDATDSLQPGARDAVALPVQDEDGGVRAIVSFSFTEKVTAASLERLVKSATTLPPF
jgi:hypothetical protein